MLATLTASGPINTSPTNKCSQISWPIRRAVTPKTAGCQGWCASIIAQGAVVMPEVILLIEDEPGIVDFLKRGLEVHGFEIRSARDGISGAARALREDVDLVVLDIMLPGRSGLEVLTDVRASKPTLPVIVLSARGEIADRVAGLDAGAVDYLTKPFSLKELVARIRTQLRIAREAKTTSLTAGDIAIDLVTRDVRRAGRSCLSSAPGEATESIT